MTQHDEPKEPEEAIDEATKKMSQAERDELFESLGEETARIQATRQVNPGTLDTSVHTPGQTAASTEPPGFLSEDSLLSGHDADTAALPGVSPLAKQPPAGGGANDVRLESGRDSHLRMGRASQAEAVSKSASGPIDATPSQLTSEEFEEERPFDLRPEEVQPQLEAVPGATSPVRRGWMRPIVLGLAAGLLLGAALYFAPWPVEFPMPAATFRTEALPEIDGQGPPAQWIAAGGVFVGVDATQRPWIHRTEPGETLRARRQGPPVEVLGTVAVYGFPDIEPVCRLIWIETEPGVVGTSATAARLHVGSFGFGGAAAEGLPRSVGLPPGEYREPPVAIPDPSDESGILIAVTDAAGVIGVYSAGAEEITPVPAGGAAGKGFAAEKAGDGALEAALAAFPDALGAVEIDLNGDGRSDILTLSADGRLRVQEGGTGPVATLETSPEPTAIRDAMLWRFRDKTLSVHGFTSDNLAFTMDIPVPVEYSAREAAQLIRYNR